MFIVSTRDLSCQTEITLNRTHDKTYNAPSVNENAVLMPNDPVGQRDIILHTRSNHL